MTEENKLPRTPPVRTGGRKAIVVWMIILFSFVAIYSMLSDAPQHGSKHGSSVPTWFVAGLFSVVAVLFVILVGVTTRTWRRFLREQHENLAALHRGELAYARDVFWKWSESRLPRIAAVSHHNLAWTLMRQGELAYAIRIATQARERYARELAALTTWPTTTVDLALFHALRGDLEPAEKLMAELEQRKDVMSNASFPAMKIFTRAVIACRRGDHAEAARMLDEHWSSCESTLTGDVVRPFRVLRAFVITNKDSRDAGKAAIQLTNARPVYPGEYDFLGVEWPEMHAFLVTHELATPSTAS